MLILHKRSGPRSVSDFASRDEEVLKKDYFLLLFFLFFSLFIYLFGGSLFCCCFLVVIVVVVLLFCRCFLLLFCFVVAVDVLRCCFCFVLLLMFYVVVLFINPQTPSTAISPDKIRQVLILLLYQRRCSRGLGTPPELITQAEGGVTDGARTRVPFTRSWLHSEGSHNKRGGLFCQQRELVVVKGVSDAAVTGYM